jgi:hypothetical protein
MNPPAKAAQSMNFAIPATLFPANLKDVPTENVIRAGLANAMG